MPRTRFQNVRLSDDEQRSLRGAAQFRAMRVGAFIRQAIAREVELARQDYRTIANVVDTHAPRPQQSTSESRQAEPAPVSRPDTTP